MFDNNTLLMWQQLPDASDHENKTHAEAITHCGAQTTGGYSDWRLPKIDELESIVNFGGANPTIDTAAFPNTKREMYWSSTVDASNRSNAWGVRFPIGSLNSNILGSDVDLYVRCVRLSPAEPEKRFTDNGDETITDKKTKLMWQQLPDASDHTRTNTWENALKRCEGLTFAGHSDWRLPNKKELLSIADRSRSGPSIDTTAFPNTQTFDYWSSTVDAGNTSKAWGVVFNRGDSSSGNRSGSGYVRCVRSAR